MNISNIVLAEKKPVTTTHLNNAGNRINSIDLLRGIIMLIMALDHVRFYFHYDAFHYDPLDLTQTTGIIFFSRWITHFCAPIFVLLTGLSAYLAGQKMKTKKELSLWLVSRGLWLVILEFTVVKFAWAFQLDYQYLLLMVIWALGISMIVLGFLIYLPLRGLLTIGILLIVGHNAFDLTNPETSMLPDLWNVLHVEMSELSIGQMQLIVIYPVLPMIGLMIIGYCLGPLYSNTSSFHRRKQVLGLTGAGMIMLFIVIRLINLYGDPSPWSTQASFLFTILSFVNTTKYPFSLLFISMTIGPALLFMAMTENWRGWFTEKLVTIGRVPLFFYILHLFIIHLMAGLAALATGFQWQDMVVKSRWISFEPELQTYGFNLFMVIQVWILIILLIYPLCAFYNQFKRKNHHLKWLSYF